MEHTSFYRQYYGYGGNTDRKGESTGRTLEKSSLKGSFSEKEEELKVQIENDSLTSLDILNSRVG